MGFRKASTRRARVTIACISLAVLLLCLLPAAPAAALTPLPPEIEPNNSWQQAMGLNSAFPIVGWIDPDTDLDWFYLDVPYATTVQIQLVPPQAQGYLAEVAVQASGSGLLVYPNWEYDFDDDGSYVRSGGVTGPCRVFAVVSMVGGWQPSPNCYQIKMWYEEGAAFPDVQEWHPFFAPITFLAEQGVVSGYEDGRFGPDDSILRAQFAKMIVRSLGYNVEETMDPPFWDLGQDDYFDLYPHEYVAVAAFRDITVGTGAGRFSPWDSITLAQVVTMVTRAGMQEHRMVEPPAWYDPGFQDFGAPHYAYARSAAFNGLFAGYYGPWNWWEPATRGQCAFFIWRLALLPRAE